MKVSFLLIISLFSTMTVMAQRSWWVKMIGSSLFILLISPMLANANDGDTFSEETVEGVLLKYTIISESEKTCMVGEKYNPAFPTVRVRRDLAEEVCQASGDITIPEEVKGYRVIRIEAYAFNQAAITTVVIPNSVESIGMVAFYSCTELKSVRLSEQLTRIEASAFFGCESLASIIIPEGVVYIGDYAFANCKQLKEITIPSSVEYYGENLFWNTGFTSLPKLPDNLTTIPNGMFYQCTQLASIEIPKNITTIGECAFGRCPISEIEIPASVTHIGVAAFANCPNLTNMTIPDNVTDIGFNAFKGCLNLKTVTLPNNISSLSKGIFSECSSLESIIIPSGVKSIGKGAFEGCSSLRSINIPDGIEEIAPRLFYNCSSLTQLIIPKSIVSIKNEDEEGNHWTFVYGCNSLTSIIVDKDNPVFDSRDNCNAIIETASNTLVAGCSATKIPESITSIGSYTFAGLESLTTIALPQSLKRIEGGTFNWSGLQEIDIPENVTFIGSYSICNCKQLKTVRSFINEPYEISEHAFYGSTSAATLYVPKGTVDKYKATKGWTNFNEIVEMTAQDDYHPLVEEGKHWTYDNFMPLRPAEYDHYYYYDLKGDTLIAGKQCLKIYSENKDNNNAIRYEGALYEENKKVYCFFPNKEAAVLLYDFDCAVGDVIQVSVGQLLVKDIQTEDNDGITIKRYILQTTSNEEVFSWIEGVGASKDFFNMLPLDGNYNSLSACELNGEKLYKPVEQELTEEGYHKMAIEGKCWNYIHYYVDEDGEHYEPYSYVVRGDTIIRRITYKKLYYQDEKTERLVCLLLERGRTVYKNIDLGNNSYDSPILKTLFEFDREDFGRVFTWKADMKAGNTNWMVYGVDTIEVKGQQFRRYTCLQKYSEEGEELTTIDYGGEGVWQDIWVEGVGSATSGIEDQIPFHEPYVRTPGEYTAFVSCYEDGKCIFTKEDFYKESAGAETAQAYRPFIEDGKVWKVGTIPSSPESPVQVVDYYYFDGDTIIDGKACKQMMRQRYVSSDSPDYSALTQTPSLSKVGAWYEEDKKVYCYDELKQSMVLKYDFSLEANDTLQFLNVDGSSFIIGPRQTGGLEGFKGVYRDIMMCQDEGPNIHSTFWLEGVGGVDGLKANAFDPTLVNLGPFLMSCVVGDEVIYLNDDYEDGATPVAAEARKRIDFTHTIKIRPKSRMLREARQSLYGEYNDQQLGVNLVPLDDAYLVRIADETGRAVYEKAINAGSIVGLSIDISDYAKGHYTVTVENSLESFIGEFETQTTGISNALRPMKDEGIRNNHIYDLQGRRLTQKPTKGVYIQDGKKVIVK